LSSIIIPLKTFDISELATYAFHNRVQVVPGRVRTKPVDPIQVQPCLAWLPLEVVKRTLVLLN
jgi:hypothetical protein